MKALSVKLTVFAKFALAEKLGCVGAVKDSGASHGSPVIFRDPVAVRLDAVLKEALVLGYFVNTALML